MVSSRGLRARARRSYRYRRARSFLEHYFPVNFGPFPMSTSLIAFLTVLENQVRPLLPEGKAWRFQRLVDFRADEATLQLWETDALAGQAQVRKTGQGDSGATFVGSVQSAGETDARRSFSFRPTTDAEVERQARIVAGLWRETMSGGGSEPPLQDALPSGG